MGNWSYSRPSDCGFTQNTVACLLSWFVLSASLNFELSSCCHSDSHLEWEQAASMWGSGSSHKNTYAHVHTLLWSCMKGAKQTAFTSSEEQAEDMEKGAACCGSELFVPGWTFTYKELRPKQKWTCDLLIFHLIPVEVAPLVKTRHVSYCLCRICLCRNRKNLVSRVYFYFKKQNKNNPYC